MIEITILDHLNAALSVPVVLEKPDPITGSVVFFEKTGSGKSNRLPSSTFAFQSYGTSLYEAAALNDAVKAAVESLVTLDEIGSVRLNSDYNFPDTTYKKHRYQAVYDISHY